MELTLQGASELIADFGDRPRRVTSAMVRAMNRSIASGRTVMTQQIAADTGMKSGDVRAAMRMQEATLSKPEARLGASLKRIPLIKFGARGPEPSRGKGRGVSYRLRGSRGRHPLAFIATMASGHRGVFVRSSKTRLPIQELFGPSLGHVFAKYRPVALARIREQFEKNFAHELDFARNAGVGSA